MIVASLHTIRHSRPRPADPGDDPGGMSHPRTCPRRRALRVRETASRDRSACRRAGAAGACRARHDVHAIFRCRRGRRRRGAPEVVAQVAPLSGACGKFLPLGVDGQFEPCQGALPIPVGGNYGPGCCKEKVANSASAPLPAFGRFSARQRGTGASWEASPQSGQRRRSTTAHRGRTERKIMKKSLLVFAAAILIAGTGVSFALPSKESAPERVPPRTRPRPR